MMNDLIERLEKADGPSRESIVGPPLIILL